MIVADCDHLATFRTDVPGGHQTCLKCGTEFCFWLPRPVVPDEVLRQLASDIRSGWSRMAADPLYRFYGGEDTPQARDEHFERRAAEIAKWNRWHHTVLDRLRVQLGHGQQKSESRLIEC